jgi:hypothetical protein
MSLRPSHLTATVAVLTNVSAPPPIASVHRVPSGIGNSHSNWARAEQPTALANSQMELSSKTLFIRNRHLPNLILQIAYQDHYRSKSSNLKLGNPGALKTKEYFFNLITGNSRSRNRFELLTEPVGRTTLLFTPKLTA